MTREENLHWIDEEIRTWENECQSKHPIKEALCAARKALEQEPCEDAVSVTSVFEIMGNLLSIPYDFDRSITEKDVSESMDEIRALPRVTPQEPRKGYWMINKEKNLAKCSNCKFFLKDKDEINLLGTFIQGYNYCPYCGADMRCDKGCDFCEHTSECMPSKEEEGQE